ncbi:hypothetical protein PCE1_000663 [Barthelona sp. PCE]
MSAPSAPASVNIPVVPSVPNAPNAPYSHYQPENEYIQEPEAVHISPVVIFFKFLKNKLCSASLSGEFFGLLIIFLTFIAQVFTILSDSKAYRFWVFVLSFILFFVKNIAYDDMFNPWSDDIQTFVPFRIIAFIFDFVIVSIFCLYILVYITNLSYVFTFFGYESDYYDNIQSFNIYERFSWIWSWSLIWQGMIYTFFMCCSILPFVVMGLSVVCGFNFIAVFSSLGNISNMSSADGGRKFMILTFFFNLISIVGAVGGWFLIYLTGTYATEITSAWIVLISFIYCLFYYVMILKEKSNDALDFGSNDEDIFVGSVIQGVLMFFFCFQVFAYYFISSIEYLMAKFFGGYTLHTFKFYFGLSWSRFGRMWLYILIVFAFLGIILGLLAYVKKCVSSYQQFAAEFATQQGKKKKGEV